MTIFKWEIKDMYNVFRSSPIVSPPFHIEPSRTFQFCLLLYPFGWDSLREMILMLCRCDSNEIIVVLRYKLQFDETISVNEQRMELFTYIFKTPSQFPERNVYLTKPISECQPILKISCEIYSNIFENIDKEVMRELSSNYESLLKEHTFSDIQLDFENRRLYLHNAILEKRCDNLPEHFRTYERFELDYRPTIIESIAQFLYSGKFTTWKTKIKPNTMGTFGSSLHKSTYPFITSEYSAKTLIDEKRYIFDWVIDNPFVDDESIEVFTYVIVEEGTNINISFDPFQMHNPANFKVEMRESGRFIRCRVDIDIDNMFINLVEMSNTETNPDIKVNQFLPIYHVVKNYPILKIIDTIKLRIDIRLCSSNYTSNVDTIGYTDIYKDDMYMYNLREDFKRMFFTSQWYDFVIIVNYERFHEDFERHFANYKRLNADYSEFSKHYSIFYARFMSLNAHYMRFPVHKVILSARSPVFRNMLRHDTMENQTGETTITDIKPYVVGLMLLFMYCGQVGNLNMELALDLNSAADKYEIKMLVKKCSDFLESNIRADTVDTIQKHARRRNMQRLETACVQFRARNN